MPLGQVNNAGVLCQKTSVQALMLLLTGWENLVTSSQPRAFIDFCLSNFSIAMMKYHDQGTL